MFFWLFFWGRVFKRFGGSFGEGKGFIYMLSAFFLGGEGFFEEVSTLCVLVVCWKFLEVFQGLLK